MSKSYKRQKAGFFLSRQSWLKTWRWQKILFQFFREKRFFTEIWQVSLFRQMRRDSLPLKNNDKTLIKNLGTNEKIPTSQPREKKNWFKKRPFFKLGQVQSHFFQPRSCSSKIFFPIGVLTLNTWPSPRPGFKLPFDSGASGPGKDFLWLVIVCSRKNGSH